MPLPPRYIAISSNCRVKSVAVPDEQKPNSRVVTCIFFFIESRGVAIPVYVYMAGPGPFQHDFAFCVGEFFFPPGSSDGWIQATKFKVLASAPLSKQLVPTPASISAVGEITTVINRDWFLTLAGCTVTFVLKVRVPDNNHFKKISTPRAGSMVFVRGLLAYIAIDEDCMTRIELEAVTFLNKVGSLPAPSEALCFDDSLTGDGFSEKSFSKRQLHEAASSTSGSPLKKSKSGPFEAFTHEEPSSEPSSQASVPVSVPSVVSVRER
ncbi:hypothetical protein FS749_002261 [Ceratobasidium sp. UAMH 11750]|nr:hypothetical protein FS749_002261 [Ceratobasidium sp. UAMH 11750]